MISQDHFTQRNCRSRRQIFICVLPHVLYFTQCEEVQEEENTKREANQLLDLSRTNRNNSIVERVLTVDGFTTVATIPSNIYYYIADIKGDEPSTHLAQGFTLVVTSDNDGKAEFLKRVAEEGDTASNLIT